MNLTIARFEQLDRLSITLTHLCLLETSICGLSALLLSSVNCWIDNYWLVQWVQDGTHDAGCTLDVVCSRGDLPSPSVDVHEIGPPLWPPSSAVCSSCAMTVKALVAQGLPARSRHVSLVFIMFVWYRVPFTMWLTSVNVYLHYLQHDHTFTSPHLHVHLSSCNPHHISLRTTLYKLAIQLSTASPCFNVSGRLAVQLCSCCSSAATWRRHCSSHRTLHHSVQLCDRL